MKKLNFLIALIISALLISCADVPNDPANDNNINKADQGYVFPYDYLQKFVEKDIIDWKRPATADQPMTVQLTSSAEDIEDLYIMVVAGDPLVQEVREHYMYFIDQPGEQALKVPYEVPAHLHIIDIKAFVLERVTEIDINAPYPDAQKFRMGYNTWEFNGNDLVISTNPPTPDVLEVFAYVQKVSEDMVVYDELIYLQRPTERVIIPDYGSENVQDVKVFVLSDRTRQ